MTDDFNALMRDWSKKPVDAISELQRAVNATVVGVKRGSEIFCLACRPDEAPRHHITYAALADGARCRACGRVYDDGEWHERPGP
jgi:hypothetical protein